MRTCASKATPDNASAAPFQYLFLSGTSFSAPTIAGVAALMLQKSPSPTNADATFGTLGNPASWGPGSFERALERSAAPIPAPNSVVTTFRTGVPDTESWGTNEVGHGWVYVDDALAAAHWSSLRPARGSPLGGPPFLACLYAVGLTASALPMWA